MKNGATGINLIRNMQIVNGGQTTASILYASDLRKADLSKVFVQMKLSVIVDIDRIDDIVPKIQSFRQYTEQDKRGRLLLRTPFSSGDGENFKEAFGSSENGRSPFIEMVLRTCTGPVCGWTSIWNFQPEKKV